MVVLKFVTAYVEITTNRTVVLRMFGPETDSISKYDGWCIYSAILVLGRMRSTDDVDDYLFKRCLNYLLKNTYIVR